MFVVWIFDCPNEHTYSAQSSRTYSSPPPDTKMRFFDNDEEGARKRHQNHSRPKLKRKICRYFVAPLFKGSFNGYCLLPFFRNSLGKRRRNGNISTECAKIFHFAGIYFAHFQKIFYPVPDLTVERWWKSLVSSSLFPLFPLLFSPAGATGFQRWIFGGKSRRVQAGET